MKRKVLSLVLALVMCLGLAAPAVAAPASPLLDEDAAEAADAPRYAVYEAICRWYISAGSYVDLTFTISYKNGTYFFESLDNLSPGVIDTSGFYWVVDGYSYRFSNNVCYLTVNRTEMYGNAPTGYSDHASYEIPIDAVVGSIGAKESNPNFISVSPVNCVIVI